MSDSYDYENLGNPFSPTYQDRRDAPSPNLPPGFDPLGPPKVPPFRLHVVASILEIT